jgi:L-ascorbate metabolism protein UlaG (beta-lactamase superfamily)
MLLEVKDRRILIDPGRFSTEQNNLTDIDIVLITHEHADHYHSESVSTILHNNPDVIVVTNTRVARLLTDLGIDAHILEGREEATIVDVPLAAYDGDHVEIFEEIGLVQNTGYFVDNTFFFPGDAYTVPDKPVKILALPVAGPWCKVSEAIHYALSVKPTIAFPVHDATLSDIGKSVTYPHFERELKKTGSDFIVLGSNVPREF